MFLDPFHRADGNAVRITAAQGSAFAKDVAGDFNPIHDATNPRFCVPGDLLFALVLSRFGVATRMSVRFTGMVSADAQLHLNQTDASIQVINEQGKSCLEAECDGEVSHDPALTEALVRRYVSFSGQNFPHILVPLMEQHSVMINPERPLVIYERMSFELERLDLDDLNIRLVESTLDVKGKRGEARLGFAFNAGQQQVGQGSKTLILSGLRDHDPLVLQGLVEHYAGWKAAYLAAR